VSCELNIQKVKTVRHCTDILAGFIAFLTHSLAQELFTMESE